jgi:transcriptional regulator with XRE-family HTH domain
VSDSLLARAKEITGCTDADLAEAMGMRPDTVRSYVSGRRREYLNAAQIATLLEVLDDYVKHTVESVELFKMMA